MKKAWKKQYIAHVQRRREMLGEARLGRMAISMCLVNEAKRRELAEKKIEA